MPDRSVYGLSLEMTQEKGAVFASIKSLASHYTQTISTIHPSGPYLSGSVSFGGMVALEVARQLQANHQEVALLALFDTPAPNAFTRKPLSKRIVGHTTNLWNFGSNYISEKLAAKLHPINYQRFKLANRPSSRTKQYAFAREIHEEMRVNYQPHAYSGRIALFLASF